MGLCFASALTVTTWGNVNARTLGTETVSVKSSILRVKEYTLNYPKVKKLKLLSAKENIENNNFVIFSRDFNFSNHQDSQSLAFDTWTTNHTQ